MFYNIDIINKYMFENKLSKEKFCKLCSISIPSLNKILNNDRSIGIVVFIKIAHALNIQVSKLINHK